jgi:2-C-methyl-D-erythritol 4-phosphate cytidylyltransferase
MPSPKESVSAIVVAGGRGTRFGGLKQFASLGGTSVARRSIEACRSVAGEVVLVVPEGTHDDHGADQVVAGGATRAASVRAGLAVIDEGAALVVIHDAARPLASPALFERVVRALDDHEAAGAICAVPVSDTIKQVEARGDRRAVAATLERSSLVAVQTPQAFRADALRKAHAGEPEATDDAALVEAAGGLVLVVDGEATNDKLTSVFDLEAAERRVAGR